MTESAYGDHHREFLQALMSRRICSTADVRRLHERACRRVGVTASRDQLAEFVNAINGRLAPLGLQVAKGCSERDGTSYYAVINVLDDPHTMACAGYSDVELRLLQLIVGELVEAAAAAEHCELTAPDEGEADSSKRPDEDTDGCCNTLTAVNLSSQLPGRVSKLDAEAMIQRLVDDSWLERPCKGRLSLHVRAVMELGGHLVVKYPDVVRKCGLCSRHAVYGRVCANCKDKFHHPCIKKYRRSASSTICPNCKMSMV